MEVLRQLRHAVPIRFHCAVVLASVNVAAILAEITVWEKKSS